MNSRFLFNKTIEYRPDSTGRGILLPALVNEDNQPLLPLLRYGAHLHGKGFSQSKLSKIREATRLFYEYSFANTPPFGFGAAQTEATGASSNWRHFANFRQAIDMGTLDPKGGVDPSGLYWSASGVSKGNDVVELLSEFFRYLDELDQKNRLEIFNPVVTGSRSEQLINQAAHEFKRSKAFLGNTWNQLTQHAAVVRSATSKRRGSRSDDEKPRISDAHFELLLEHGFGTSTLTGLRNCLIAILMNKGGLRLSEALHLWVVDVIEDPAQPDHALVTVVNPDANGCSLTFHGKKFDTRSAYLSIVYGVRPRTQLPRSDLGALGWKAKHDELVVWWFPTFWGAVFWKLWRDYLHKSVDHRIGHPYAFISHSDGKNGPLASDSFSKAYERGIYAAGLVPPGGCDMKSAGLTPHGCRHAYGNRAANEAEMSKKAVMMMMHHTSEESQNVYTKKGNSELRSAIDNGMRRLRSSGRSAANIQADLMSLPSALRKVVLGDSAIE